MAPRQQNRRGTPAPDGRSTPTTPRPDTPSSMGGGADRGTVIVGLSFGSDYSVIALPGSNVTTTPTTNGAAATSNGNAFLAATPEVIANEDGDHKIPSVVALTGHGVLTATAAKQQAASNLRNTATRFRDLLGANLDSDDVSTFSQDCQVSVVEAEGDATKPALEFTVIPDGAEEEKTSQMTPRQVVAHHLRRLRESAAAYTGKTVTGCDVSCPPDWNTERRTELLDAAAEAGFSRELCSVIAEPTAAVLALDTLRPTIHPATAAVARISLVVDIGGRHTSASLMALSPSPTGSLHTLLAHRTEPIGCAALDKLLARHFADEFCRKYKLGGPEEIGRRGLSRLAAACEATKRSLSSAGASTGVANVESLWDGVDLRGSINRVRWEGLMEPWVRSVGSTVSTFVADGKVPWEEIAEVVLIGGGSKIPRLQAYLRSLLPESTPLRLPNAEGLDADELIAMGCGIQAQLITSMSEQGQPLPKEGEVPHLAESIGIMVPSAEGGGGEEEAVWVLPKWSALPVRKAFAVGAHKGAEQLFVRIIERNPVAGKPHKVLVELAIPMEGQERATVAVTAEAEAVSVSAECGGRVVKGRCAKEGAK